MIFAYIVFCFVAMGVGFIYYRKIYNPISLYTAVWVLAVGLYSGNLIEFYDLSYFSWIVIFLGHLLFVCGCLLGVYVKPVHSMSIEHNDCLLKKNIFLGILVTLLLSSVAIVGNVKTMMSIYGVNLYENVIQIYADRVNESQKIETIPYLSSFIFISLPLLGVYTKKYGFNLIVIPSFILVCLNSLVSGGRAGIVFSLLLFSSAYICTKGGNTGFSLGKKLAVLIGIILFSLMIAGVSEQRTAGVSIRYVTPLYMSIFGDNVALYKAIAYVAAPIGTLNEYLKSCDFHFGENTFLTIYNILAKFGLCERINQYQEFFLTPIPCNVGTWIREIVEDFTVVGAIFFIPFFGFMASLLYCCAEKYPLISYKVIWSVCSLIILLSFFDWRLRTSNMWIALLFGYLIGCYIDRKSVDYTRNMGKRDG